MARARRRAEAAFAGLHRRPLRARGERRHVRQHQSRHRPIAGHGRGRRTARHRSRGRERARRVPPRQLVAAAAEGAQEGAAASSRSSCSRNREELALLETLDMGKPISDSLAVDIPSAANCIRWYARSGRQDLRRSRAHGPERARHHHARAHGRGRRHRAVEFPAADGVLEDRPGARQRQFAGAQAFGEIAADRAARRGAGDGGGPARRRVQRGAGFGHTAGKALASSHGRGLHRVHGLHRHRQDGDAVRGAVQPQEGVARVRRQVAQHRARRLPGSRQGGHRGGLRHLLQPGRDVFGGLAPAGARTSIKDALLEKIAAVGRDDGARRSARSGDQARRDRRRNADEARAVVHRRRQDRRRAAWRWAASACARTAAGSSSSPRCSMA